MSGFFVAIFVSWSLVALFHLLRYAGHRRYVSLLLCASTLGWPLFAARELRWLKVAGTIPFVAAAAVLGLLVLGLLLFHQLRQPHPFR